MTAEFDRFRVASDSPGEIGRQRKQESGARRYMTRRYHTPDQMLVNALESRLVMRYLSALAGPGDSVLDMPCGYGRFTGAAIDLGMRVTAADLKPAMLALVSERVGPIPTYQCHCEDLPFEDDAFDVALCVRLLQHLHEPAVRRRTLRELARVSRHGVVLTVYDRVRLHTLVHGSRVQKRLHHYSRDALHEDLEQAGLRIRDEARLLPGLHAQHVLMLEHRH